MAATKKNNMDLAKGVKEQPRFYTFHLLHEINQIRRWVGSLKEHQTLKRPPWPQWFTS